MAKDKNVKQAQEPEQVSESEKQSPEKQKDHLDGPLTRSYRCFFCGRYFMSQALLIAHMRREHNGDE